MKPKGWGWGGRVAIIRPNVSSKTVWRRTVRRWTLSSLHLHWFVCLFCHWKITVYIGDIMSHLVITYTAVHALQLDISWRQYHQHHSSYYTAQLITIARNIMSRRQSAPRGPSTWSKSIWLHERLYMSISSINSGVFMLATWNTLSSALSTSTYVHSPVIIPVLHTPVMHISSIATMSVSFNASLHVCKDRCNL